VPELPEVEIVCRNLSSIIGENKKVEGWDFYRNDLRGKIPKTELEKLIEYLGCNDEPNTY
jgi:formamidopyrimidine-DNA glycosylase